MGAALNEYQPGRVAEVGSTALAALIVGVVTATAWTVAVFDDFRSGWGVACAVGAGLLSIVLIIDACIGLIDWHRKRHERRAEIREWLHSLRADQSHVRIVPPSERPFDWSESCPR